MKAKCLLSKWVLPATLLFVSQVATAQMTSCPSIEDLKNFFGFSVEYPLNLDVNTQQPLSWLVAQTQLNKKKQTVKTFVQSPVKSNQDEYPLDAAVQMIDSLVPLENNPRCIDELTKNTSICVCPYWNPNDGSVASFIATEYKSKNAPSLATQLEVSTKILSFSKNIPH